jgi:hypothetical protein
MADLVNLRQARKRRQREEKAAGAAANRLLHGRTRAEKAETEIERERGARLIEGHRRSGNPADKPGG